MRCRHCRSDLRQQGGSLNITFTTCKWNFHLISNKVGLKDSKKHKSLFISLQVVTYSIYLAVCLSIYPCGHLIDIYPHPGGDLSRRGKTEPSFTLNIWSSDILIYLLMWYIIFVDVIKLYVWKPLMKYICWDIQIWNKAWLKIGVEDEDLAKVEVLEIPKRGGDTAHLQKVKRCGHTLQRRLWWSESQRPGSTACGWKLVPTSAPVLQIMLWAAFLSSKYNCNMLFKFYRFNWIT